MVHGVLCSVLCVSSLVYPVYDAASAGCAASRLSLIGVSVSGARFRLLFRGLRSGARMPDSSRSSISLLPDARIVCCALALYVPGVMTGCRAGRRITPVSERISSGRQAVIKGDYAPFDGDVPLPSL